MAYYKDTDFYKQVLKSKYKRPVQMKNYIDSLYKNFLEPNGLGDIISDLPHAIKISKKKIDNRLSNLLRVLRLVAAKEKSDPNSFYFYGKELASFNQWLVVLELYIDFIKKLPGGKGGTLSWEKQWDNTLKLLESQIESLDGNVSLIKLFGNKKRFIEEALKNSIFMNPINVNSRFIDIQTAFNSTSTTPLLFARKSENGKIQTIQTIKPEVRFFNYVDLNGTPRKIKIRKDKDGNEEVRRIIKNSTGFDVSNGAKSNIINYKISHIWQNAFDPRYFTNLWNIVLVPSWANDLLDKTKFANLFILQLINTYRAVCEKYYQMNLLDWNSIQMQKPEIKNQFVISGDYEILYFDNNGQISTTKVVLP